MVSDVQFLMNKLSCLFTSFSYTVSGAYEPLKATKEHETQFHDCPHYA